MNFIHPHCNLLENIYKIYCLQNANNNRFIGRIRGFNITKTALIKNLVYCRYFLLPDNFKFGYIFYDNI
jgi:hypothetical protein